MNKLIITPNIANFDDFYEELLQVHDDKSKQESDDINAQLILILTNHIGDRKIITEAFELSQKNIIA